MAKFKGKLSLRTINSLKGFLDFYTRGDETIVRTWPKNRGKSQTPNSIPWQAVFKQFMECHSGWWVGGPLYVPPGTTGREWTSRDYLMSTYYGKMKMPPGFLYDNRQPWPPPVPDPLHRFFLINHPIGSYSIFSGVNLIWQRCPPGFNTLYITYEPPLYHYQSFTRRRSKHIKIAAFTPRDSSYLVVGSHFFDHRFFNNRTSFFRDLDRWFYFFMVSQRTDPPTFVSQSPWFACKIIPGVGGGEFGATLNGPHVLTPWHLKHPDLTRNPII